MQTRLEIFKEITALFISSDYKEMKTSVVKYFTLAESFRASGCDEVKRFLYLVHLLILLKENKEAEAIDGMLLCLKANKGHLDDLFLKNTIYFIVNSMAGMPGLDTIYLNQQEIHGTHPAYVNVYNFFNRLPADVLLETAIAAVSFDKDFDKNDTEEFISVFNAWLKRGLEKNHIIAHINYPFKLCLAMSRRNTDIPIDEFLQQNYYPALESLAFSIITHRVPTIKSEKYKEYFKKYKTYFLVNVGGKLNSILGYFSPYFTNKFLNNYQVSDALSLLNQLKFINPQLNKAIKFIDHHLNLEQQSQFQKTPYHIFLLPPVHHNRANESSYVKNEQETLLEQKKY